MANTLRDYFSQTDRPNPDLGAYTEFSSSASSAYHGLDASIERRFGSGPVLRSAYTWSHAIDDVSDVFDLAGASALAQDELGRQGGLRAERASANFDVRHRSVTAWHVPLPLGEGRLRGGWGLSGILQFQTGQPFTVTTSLDANLDGNLTDRLDTTDGITRVEDGPRVLLLDPSRSLLSFVAPVDTEAPVAGRVGRNTFRGRGIASLDLALSKRIDLGGGRALTLRVEAFNALNRTHFALPVRVLEAPGFGASTSTLLPARVVQLGARVSF